MNKLAKVLDSAIKEKELETASNQSDGWRSLFHIEPPIGWLNDPNGLCYYQGEYHFFFQYAPFSSEDGLKFWGKYTSKDMLHWKYEGVILYPDNRYDCHGVYSGSAFVEDGKLELFYTGNVLLSGEYDYILAGREGNTLLTTSQDGKEFSPKQLLLGSKDYPSQYSCHIRDPKVWKEKDTYYMVLGARRRDDKGCVLLYESKDKLDWHFAREIGLEEAFGYMWECPDVFTLDGIDFLSVSPQGLERHRFYFQNVYQSGYFRIKDKENWQLEDFVQWDYGFDFYAPQTFVDSKGRRILVPWAGLPDIKEEYSNPTTLYGWQHMFGVPRQLHLVEGQIYQQPIEEIATLRDEGRCLDESPLILQRGGLDIEAQLEGVDSWKLSINETCQLSFCKGIFALEFLDEIGGGRKTREIKIDSVHSLRIIEDMSILEIFINDGAYTMTSRYYPKETIRRLAFTGGKSKIWVWQLSK